MNREGRLVCLSYPHMRYSQCYSHVLERWVSPVWRTGGPTMADTAMQQYLLLAKGGKARTISELISKATSDPSLFAFGELLDLPPVKEVRIHPYFG